MLQVWPDNVIARAVLLGAIFLVPITSFADAYSDARAELVAAYQAQDFAAMRTAAHKSLEARPGYPGALFNLALAQALDGALQESLQTLGALVTAGIDYDVADIEEFASLQQLDDWDAYQSAAAKLHEPVGHASVAYSYDVADFVPEGIAITPAGELLLGSVRHGTIVSIGEHTQVISEAETHAHWSVFGMRQDGAGGLWFASAAVPEFAASDETTAGRTGLFRLDIKTQAITQRTLLPSSDDPRVLGDLVIADEDTIYATESLTGVLYRYSISSEQFTEVVPQGVMRSMQGLVLDATGDYLYVADYVGGLFRVALVDGAVTRVTSDPAITVFGIDGLYRHGNELIVIQNGIAPNRVVALTLAEDGLSIVGKRTLAANLKEFDEPTLGVVHGDAFFFVANSHWNRFDREGNLAEDLTGPIILKVRL